MTNIKSPLGNLINRPTGNKNTNQPPTQIKKTFFVSDESDKNFEIPELDYPQAPTKTNKVTQQERIDFQSAEEFNQFRSKYLETSKKKQESIQEEVKQNIEALLGLGVRDDKIVIDSFGFCLRTLTGTERETIEEELIDLRHETLKKHPGIKKDEMNAIIINSRLRRILARAIIAVYQVENGKEVNRQSFDEYLGLQNSSSDSEFKLQIVGHFQEPLRNILVNFWSELEKKAPNNFPTIEALAAEIKK